METTMIQIKKETAQKLKSFKEYKKQSYDEVINSLFLECEAEGLTEKERKNIEEALEDVKAGRMHRIEDVAKEFGVKLGA